MFTATGLAFKIETLSAKLSELQKANQSLAQELAEKQKRLDELSTKLADEQDENAAIKKKHAANIKDLTRQLQILQKKAESSGTPSTASNTSQSSSSGVFKTPDMPASNHYQHEHLYKTASMSEQNISSFISSSSVSSSTPSAASSSNQHYGTKSTSSRTNSISSLNDKESLADRLERGSRSSMECTPTTTTAPGGNMHRFNEVICGNEDVYVVDIDKQKIIDKIVKLQKMLARRNEKIDFLQDHVTQLTNDVKRKTK